MRVLLTGASSFLGSHLAQDLSRAGLRVTGTYRSHPAPTEESRGSGDLGDYQLVQLDLADRESFTHLPRSVDVVVHVAGISAGPGVSVDDMVACNVTGACNLINYALVAGAKRLIYMSSLSIHGQIQAGVVDETTPIVAPDPYGATKYFAERMFAASSDRLPSIALRLPGVLGRGAHRAWVPTLLDNIRSSREITIYNPDGAFNNAVHTDDISRFVHGLILADRGGSFAFPIGASGTLTIRQVVDRLQAAAGARVPVRVLPAGRPSFIICSDYAVRNFGYNPMNIGEMLDRYVAETLQRD